MKRHGRLEYNKGEEKRGESGKGGKGRMGREEEGKERGGCTGRSQPKCEISGILHHTMCPPIGGQIQESGDA